MNENALPRLKSQLVRAEQSYSSAVVAVNRFASEDLTDPDTAGWENLGRAVAAAAKYAGRVSALRDAIALLEV